MGNGVPIRGADMDFKDLGDPYVLDSSTDTTVCFQLRTAKEEQWAFKKALNCSAFFHLCFDHIKEIKPILKARNPEKYDEIWPAEECWEVGSWR